MTAFFLAACSGLAQMSAIEGYVKDSGKPVANAVIQIVRQDVNRSYQAKTDKRGSYFQQGLPVGFYAIKIVVDGQERAGVSGVRTQPGNPLEVSFDLDSPPQQQELRIQSELKKAGAEWSLVKIMTVQQQGAPAPAPASTPAGASIPPAPSAASPSAAKQPANNPALQLFNSGREALDAKKYDEAVASLLRASELDPTQPAIWANLAAAYFGLAGTATGPQSDAAMAQALAAYAKTLDLKPGDAPTHYSYALALAKTRKWDQMREEMKKAAELDPSTAYRTYYNLGTVLSNAGEAQASSEAYKLAIAAAPGDPKNAESYYQFGLSLVSQAKIGADGKTIPAPGTLESLQKYLLLAPNGANAQAARDLLTTMGSGRK